MKSIETLPKIEAGKVSTLDIVVWWICPKIIENRKRAALEAYFLSLK
jgi:hypothetical protein